MKTSFCPPTSDDSQIVRWLVCWCVLALLSSCRAQKGLPMADPIFYTCTCAPRHTTREIRTWVERRSLDIGLGTQRTHDDSLIIVPPLSLAAQRRFFSWLWLDKWCLIISSDFTTSPGLNSWEAEVSFEASGKASSDRCHSMCAWGSRLSSMAVQGRGKEWRLCGQPDLVVGPNAAFYQLETSWTVYKTSTIIVWRTETIVAPACQSCDNSMR